MTSKGDYATAVLQHGFISDDAPGSTSDGGYPVKVEVQLVDSIRPVIYYEPGNANVPEAEEKLQAMHFVTNPTPVMKKAVAEDESFRNAG